MRLAELLTTAQRTIDQTAPADAYVRCHLGTAIAERIHWRAEYWAIYGVMELDDARVEFRYEVGDPTQEWLGVRVPCPADATCPGPAWMPIACPYDLSRALAGDETGRWYCEQCDED